ncbi:MAG: MmgE/PrpD family protein [Nitrososphaerales archaeon]
MTVIEELSEFVSNFQLKAGDPAEDALRIHLVDTIGAIVAGNQSREGRSMESIFASSNIMSDIIVRCASTRLTEIDDIHMRSCTTPGSVMVPAMMTLAATTKKRNLQDSIIIGYELMTRLGSALNGPKIVYDGLWPTYLTASFASAGAASKLYDLETTQITHALAIALAFPIGPIPRIRSKLPSRWFALGLAVQNGVLASLAAKVGFEGDTSLLESDSWFKKKLGIEFELGTLTQGLGENLGLSRTSLKPHCLAKQATSGLECFKNSLDSGVKPEKIRSIIVSVPEYYMEMISRMPVKGDRLSSISSLPYRISLLAYKPEKLLDIDHMPLEIPKDQIELSSKINVIVDASLNSYYPDSFPARIKVETECQTFEAEVIKARGDPEKPLTLEEVKSKFKNSTKRNVDSKSTEDLFRTVNSPSPKFVDQALNFLTEFWKRAVPSSQSGRTRHAL